MLLLLLALITSVISITTEVLHKSTLPGFLQNDNFVWSAVVNLCFNDLAMGHNKEKVKMQLADENSKKQLGNLNQNTVKMEQVPADSYFFRTGIGKSILEQINKQLKQKYQHVTKEIKLTAGPKDIIGLALFQRNVSYLVPLKKLESFQFMQTNVIGFSAETAQQRKSIEIADYFSDDDFIVRMKLRQPDDELYLVKGHENQLPQNIVKMVQDAKKQETLKAQDRFAIPHVQFNIERQLQQLINKKITNGKLKGHRIIQLRQVVKFKLDDSEKAMTTATKSALGNKKGRKLLLDKSFWIVMKQKDKHPYLIVNIVNDSLMKKQTIINKQL